MKCGEDGVCDGLLEIVVLGGDGDDEVLGLGSLSFVVLVF